LITLELCTWVFCVFCPNFRSNQSIWCICAA